MSAAASSTSTTDLLQDFVGDFHFHSRRLLLHNPLYQPPSTATVAASPISAAEQYPGDNSFDANVVMVLSVLLCALICSLGLNSIIKCALRCSNFVSPGNNNNNNNNSSANTGVKKKALKTFPTVNYSADLNPPGLDTECVICLSEFAVGDRVRLLPKCHHGFHVRCIDKWLSSHSSCPKCRHNLIETCQKIVDFGHASSSDPVLVLPPLQEAIVRITPLAPEALVRNYRGNI